MSYLDAESWALKPWFESSRLVFAMNVGVDEHIARLDRHVTAGTDAAVAMRKQPYPSFDSRLRQREVLTFLSPETEIAAGQHAGRIHISHSAQHAQMALLPAQHVELVCAGKVC